MWGMLWTSGDSGELTWRFVGSFLVEACTVEAESFGSGSGQWGSGVLSESEWETALC